MSLLLEGSAPPALRVAPPSAASDGPDACFLSAAYGLTADDWQELAINDWLASGSDDKFAAGMCGLCVARQNGKNAALEIRELFGMVELGEVFIHTAHEVKTARKAFKRLLWFFGEEVADPSAQFGELNALVVEIRKTNGQEAILLSNGGSIEFVARSRGSARGFTADVLVFDEAQELNDEQLEALLPTISAAPLGNPQVIYTGTPPNPEKGQLGLVFRRIRNSAADEGSRITFTDFGTEGPMPDIDDRDEWTVRNPALSSGRLNMSVIEDERTAMSPEGFARERLCWWGDPAGAAASVFSPGAWVECGTKAKPPHPAALGLALDADRVWLSLAACSDAARPHLGAVRRVRLDEGHEMVLNEVERITKKRGIAVVIDAKGPAATLIPALEERGVDVARAGLEDYVQGCADLFDRVEVRALSHGFYDDLDEAVAAAGWRYVGDRRVWSRKSGDVSMLEAATLALWGATETTYDVDESYL